MTRPTPDGAVPVVHLVEDDRAAREATARFLRAAGHVVKTYATALEFLESGPGSRPGCVVLDLRLPGPSGLDLQEALRRAEEPLPIVFLSGQGDVRDSVRAMKGGAVDFLTKAAEGSALLEAVGRAIGQDGEDRVKRSRLRELKARFEQLSTREREVFAHLISGQLNKQVGFDLGISEHTIKIHRGRVLQKMQAASIADLVRMATELGIEPVGAV
jgi:FixJ family two-component response regulator